MGAAIDRVLDELEAAQPAAVKRLSDLLAIPSVSAQPGHSRDCVRAAEWVRDTLVSLGFSASLRPTAGHPVVLAHHVGPEGGPHVLFYGHYDVQPPDPVALWTSPPFEPQVVDGPSGRRIVARGACDDKGQVAAFLESLRAWHAATGSIPVRMTVLIEGEEEVGSVNLPAFLRSARDELGADFVLISDSTQWSVDAPAITTSLRGLVYMQVDVRGPDKDLHSGLFGGLAMNPINVLTRVLGDLHDNNGHVQVPGFYDRVREVPAEQAAAWEGLGFDEAAFLGHAGLTHAAGERDRPPLQRLWARPTADINGIWGGYTEAGAKTVIPSEAHAKVSFRLVPDMDPHEVQEGFRRFVRDRLPPGVQATFQEFGAGAAIVIPADSRWVRAASASLQDEFGRAPVLMGGGGSIPVVETFKSALGMDSVLMGFALDDDGAHSPNEKFELSLFRHGARAHARLLGRLAAGG
ncbi:MAG TPA: dipeptidase [Acidisphaera sp.]|nr:dipeptidase [Acidisphaera sp.]